MSMTNSRKIAENGEPPESRQHFDVWPPENASTSRRDVAGELIERDGRATK